MSQPVQGHVPDDKIVFTVAGIWGIRMSVALSIGVLVYGAVFGMLARQTGLTLFHALLMSGIVRAGTAQFLVLELWQFPLPIVTITVTTFLVNLRHVLFGAALRPWFHGLSGMQRYGSAFLMADENWAMAMKEFDQGNRDAAVMLGGGLPLMVGWLGGTCLGYLLGATVPSPETWGLDFAFTAVFLAMLASLWRGRRQTLPWLTAALVAALTAAVIPGSWYIVTGGIAGSIVGGLARGE